MLQIRNERVVQLAAKFAALIAALERADRVAT
jgi:hypothetical protein